MDWRRSPFRPKLIRQAIDVECPHCGKQLRLALGTGENRIAVCVGCRGLVRLGKDGTATAVVDDGVSVEERRLVDATRGILDVALGRTVRTVRMPTTRCSACGAALTATTGSRPGVLPSEGAISVCYGCGTLARFDADLNLVPLSEYELQLLEDDPDIKMLRAVIAAARRDVRPTS